MKERSELTLEARLGTIERIFKQQRAKDEEAKQERARIARRMNRRRNEWYEE